MTIIPFPFSRAKNYLSFFRHKTLSLLALTLQTGIMKQNSPHLPDPRASIPYNMDRIRSSNAPHNTYGEKANDLTDYFTDILLSTFHYRRNILLLWLLILSSVFALDFIVLLLKKRRVHSKTKAKANHTELATRRRRILFRCVIGYTLLVLLFFSWALPPYRDAMNHSVVEIDTIYSRDDHDYHWFAPNVGGEVSVIINDERIRMELYPGFSQNDFPEGVFHAKILYAEESKIILDMNLLDN